MLRNSYFRNAARLLLYGGLAGFIFYTQPVPRCLLNPFSERDLLAVCRYASEVVFLSQEFSAYAATDAINMYLQRGQIDEAVALSDRAIGPRHRTRAVHPHPPGGGGNEPAAQRSRHRHQVPR